MSDAVAALRAGESIVLPTDTVYGLAAAADTAAPTEKLYALKGRAASQPSALLAAGVDALFAWVPELDELVVRTLLPGPYTLVLPNPARRLPWLTGTTPAAIGVRVPVLPRAAAVVVAAVGCVVATSANEAGGPDPRRVEEIPAAIRERVGAIVDAGELPGTSSTVLDFTGGEPRVLREGAAPSAAALARVRLARS
ncbi:MAG: L-threonylcarbamoyladenylate synthase [Gaiellaceae bacterium]